jgi:hypothetical protein
MKFIARLALLAFLDMAGVAFAQTPIAVQNPSFETGTLSTSNSCPDGSISKWNFGPVPSWTVAGTASSSYGVLVPAHCVYPSVPDGIAILYTNGPTLTQDLGISASAGSTYILTAYVGHRLNGNIAQSSTVSLFVGSTVACSTTVQLSTIAPGTFLPVSCLYTAPVAPPAGDLIISLSTAGAQSDFDNVSMTVNQRHATLTWQDAVNPVGTKYNVYRQLGVCSPSPVFTQIASGLAAQSYVDGTITQNQNYCYAVSAVFNSTESMISTTLYVPQQPASLIAQ